MSLASLAAALERIDVVPDVAERVAASLNTRLRAAEAHPKSSGVQIVRTDGRGNAFLSASLADLAEKTAEESAPEAAGRALP